MLYDVIISGAGPVGLSLALCLGKSGKSALVLEKNGGLSEHSKAPAIWPPTQEILESMGVLKSFEDDAFLVSSLDVWDSDKNRSLLKLPLEELRDLTPFPRLMILPQSKTEKKLYEALGGHKNVEVKFSCQVLRFEETIDGVHVVAAERGREQEFLGKFLIGCDGAHSVTREKLGLELEGATYDFKAALADIHVASSFQNRFPRVSFSDRMVVAIQIEENVWRLIFPFSKTFKEKEDIPKAVDKLFGKSEYELVWTSEFKLHNRVSKSFGKGRVYLAGDAAHLNSPVGGQGMNSGIQDAKRLSECLINALDFNRPEALNLYKTERESAVSSKVNSFTDKLTKTLLFREGRYARFLFKLVALLVKSAKIKRKLLLRMAMLQ